MLAIRKDTSFPGKICSSSSQISQTILIPLSLALPASAPFPPQPLAHFQCHNDLRDPLINIHVLHWCLSCPWHQLQDYFFSLGRRPNLVYVSPGTCMVRSRSSISICGWTKELKSHKSKHWGQMQTHRSHQEFKIHSDPSPKIKDSRVSTEPWRLKSYGSFPLPAYDTRYLLSHLSLQMDEPNSS